MAIYPKASSGQLDLFGAFSRTSEVTSRWGYGESCPIWKKMVTERSGACSARRKRARHQRIRCFILAKLPDTRSPYGGEVQFAERRTEEDATEQNLTAMAINGELGQLGDPQASDHVEARRTAKESNQKCLGRGLESNGELADPASREPWQSQARYGGQDTSGGSEDTRWPLPPRRRAVRVGRTTGHRSSIRIGWNN